MIAVYAVLQSALDPLFDRRTAGGEHIVERRTRDHGLNRGLGGRAHGGCSIQLPKYKFVRSGEVVVDGCVELDHVLIAGQHQRFLGLPLKPPRAMLHVPLVSGGFGVPLGSVSAETDFDNTHAPVLHPSEFLDGPRQLVVNSRAVMWQYLPAESLNDSDLVRRDDVDAVQDHTETQDRYSWLDKFPPVTGNPQEGSSYVDTPRDPASMIPYPWQIRGGSQFLQNSAARTYDMEQAQRIHHDQER